MKIKRCHFSKDKKNIYNILIELRPEIKFEEFIKIYQVAHKANRFNFYGLWINQSLVAVIGMRILVDYVHGKHLYVDDLVVTAKMRNQGLGAKLLAFAENLSARRGYRCVRLCTGIKAIDSQRFYGQNQWEKRAVVFKKYHESPSSF